MSDTPKTDAAVEDPRCINCADDPRDFVPGDFARDLERQNADLLTALKVVESWRTYVYKHALASEGSSAANQAMRDFDAARAAIAKAEGK